VITELRGDDLRARLLVLGLAVCDAPDFDVEHVDLAVDGEVGAVGAGEDRGVERPVPGPLRDAAREQEDAELPRPSPGGAQRRPVEGLGALEELPAAGQQAPLLRESDKLRPVAGSSADQALGGVEVAPLVGGRVELYSGYPQASPLRSRLRRPQLAD
jgi:hypothetical protein